MNFSMFIFFNYSYMMMFISYVLLFFCNLYIYIYIIIKIIFLYKIVKENVSNKSKKLEAKLKNLCMLNDFKEGDKIVFELKVNISNNKI